MENDDAGNNMVLHLFREIRKEMGEIRASQVKTEMKIDAMNNKLTKLTVNVVGVRSRLRKAEEEIEALAEVVHTKTTNPEVGL